MKSTGFFGTRGKKGPFEFRGKFVGVRGKKIPDGSLRRLAMELNGLQPELQSAALMGPDMESNKRAPSGFQGVRGKKWTGKFPFYVSQNFLSESTTIYLLQCVNVAEKNFKVH